MENNKNKINPVVHFEMPYEDKNRMADFYTKSFGWKHQILGPEMGEYVLAMTSEGDEKGFPKNPGMINGGFFKKTEDKLTHYPSVVISVEDINESMKKVREAGGKIPGEPMEIPGYGMYVMFFDTEGNKVGMMEPFVKM
ncbi:MAG: Glyoxalase/bleomycin resistance protein/dioxygenase [uncultured bacterium]|nr:MAG: Glyoxalase/bleomycin resistance protein/dioxygenase [uncultured bacterium]